MTELVNPNDLHCKSDIKVCSGESYCSCQCAKCHAAYAASPAWYAAKKDQLSRDKKMEKKITKVRLEHDDGTFAELTDPAEVARWSTTLRDQAVMAFNRGFVLEPFKWVEGKIVGAVCSCGHVHTKRYCGHVSGAGEEQVTCICDDPPPFVPKEYQDAVCRYVNAQGRHMAPRWKEHFAEAFDLEEDRGNPYFPLVPRKRG